MHLSSTTLNIALGLLITALTVVLMLFGDVAMSGTMWLDAVLHPQGLSGQIAWGIRLPRDLTAAGVGAMLGLSGAIMQGLLRNPLAEPGLLGVSSGAGLGASIAIVLGIGLVPFAVEGFALLGALAVAIILLISLLPQRAGRRPEREGAVQA